MNLTGKQKILIAGGFVGLLVLLVYFVFIGKDTPKPPVRPPPAIPNPATPRVSMPTLDLLQEVYYADKGGTNETRYKFTKSSDAEAYANELGGTLATYEQLKDAQMNGLDVCWFGWAKDGKIYTATSTPNSDPTCAKPAVGLFSSVRKGGAWVYGIKKPKMESMHCNDPNTTISCVLPFSKTKWSQLTNQ